MRIDSILIFDGCAEEAINFYANVFDVKAEIHKYKDSPETEEFKVPEDQKENVIHAEIIVGMNKIMASDATPNMPLKVGNNFNISLTFDTEEELKKIYEKLSENGKIIVAANKTFFAKCFAMFVDKFGICWQLIVF